MIGNLSDFLDLLELRGQGWCFVDISSGAGFSVPPSDSVLIYCVLEGSARIAGISGGTIELGVGHVAIILSGEAHAVRDKAESAAQTLPFLREDQKVDIPPTFTVGKGGPTAARLLCARLQVSWPGGLRSAAMPPVVKVIDPLDRDTRSLRAATFQMAATGPGATALLTRLASLMLTLSLRLHPQCPLLFRSSASNDPIARALQLIASNPAAHWSIAELARKVSMGRSSFAARFATEVGRTPMEVITEKRMNHAVELLQESDAKIVDVSARVGYRSEAAFSRRFTRHFGVSPGRMRQNAQLSLKHGSALMRWQPVFNAGELSNH